MYLVVELVRRLHLGLKINWYLEDKWNKVTPRSDIQWSNQAAKHLGYYQATACADSMGRHSSEEALYLLFHMVLN